MIILIRFFFVLFATIIQCQTQSVNPNNNIGACSCDLTARKCDVSCCCDADCSTADLKVFECDSKANQDANSIPLISSVHSKCFKDIPIYQSNSPYVIQKSSDLVCVGSQRNTDSDSYQKVLNQKLNISAAGRSINTDISVLSPLGTPTNLNQYQVGTSIFRYLSATNTSSYYSLPIKIFNSEYCSGFQPITYLNDFTSTCTQAVDQNTCNNGLDTSKYINSFCLIKYPSALAGNLDNICCSASGTPSSFSGNVCSNALQSLTLIIYYNNPSGITNCTVSLTPGTATGTFEQTFSVQFLQSGSSASTTARSGNPGYLQGASIIAGIVSGTSISTVDFSILKASSQVDCYGTDRIPVRFGQNVQSICQFSSSTTGSCPSLNDLRTIFVSNVSSDLYVAAYGNPDSSNITGYWLRVTSCTSEIGSSNAPVCQQGYLPSVSGDQCYIRLDIQIVYANIGAVTNPQPVLGAVVFYYQRTANTSASSSLITQSVTFQDVSNPPVTAGDQIPRPNIRQVGDFFYPFSLNRGPSSTSFSAFFYLLIICVFALM